jgi:hypothetical protein
VILRREYGGEHWRSAEVAAVDGDQSAVSTVLRSRSSAPTPPGRPIDDLIARLQQQIIFSRLCADRNEARDLVATGKFLSHALKTLKQMDLDFERAMAPTRPGRSPRGRGARTPK